MDDIIQSYLESSEPFNRFFGADGMVQLKQSAVSPKLLDFEIIDIPGSNRPLDADDLKAIGAILIALSDRLKEKNNG